MRNERANMFRAISAYINKLYLPSLSDGTEGFLKIDSSGFVKKVTSSSTEEPTILNLGTVATTNNSYTGIVITVNVSSNSIGIGGILAINSSGQFVIADADAVETTNLLVLALESGTGSKKVLISGQYCNTSWNWTPGSKLYLSTTDGTLTQTQPSGTDDVIIAAGVALTTNTILFNPDLTYSVRV